MKMFVNLPLPFLDCDVRIHTHTHTKGIWHLYRGNNTWNDVMMRKAGPDRIYTYSVGGCCCVSKHYKSGGRVLEKGVIFTRSVAETISFLVGRPKWQPFVQPNGCEAFARTCCSLCFLSVASQPWACHRQGAKLLSDHGSEFPLRSHIKTLLAYIIYGHCTL